MDATAIWQSALAHLSTTIARPTFQVYFAPTKAIELRDNSLVIQCPDIYTAQYLFGHAHGHAITAVRWAAGRELEIVWVTVDGETPAPTCRDEQGSALNGYPRWLHLLWKIAEPHAARDTLLLEWAADKSPTMLLETAQQLLMGWDEYRRRRKYQDARRSFMAWYRVAQNGGSRSRVDLKREPR